MKLFTTKRLALISGIVNLIILLQGCNGDPQKRPSPPARDSLIINNVKLIIDYSSPGVKERKIWGDLIPFNEVWRTGANKATYLQIDGMINIEDTPIPPGRYSVFTIPSDSTWTIILNKDWDQWGAYNYDDSKDIARFIVTPYASDFDERMSFSFEKDKLIFDWDKLSYALKIGL